MPSDCCRVYAYHVFLLERGQTNKHTDATEPPSHAGGYNAGMGNEVFEADSSVVTEVHA